jgi:hypothetical protein
MTTTMPSADQPKGTIRTVTIMISPGKTGMFFASCENEPTFFVSAVGLPNLWAALPSAIEYLYSSKYHIDVKAFPLEQGNFGAKPFALVPHDLLALKAKEASAQLESSQR